ncbi:pyrokinin-1 receptor-like [Anopheles ziemanni]|uniref:pyrokinin-1 receptor-like n=1 Tax=Anopheles coustani TaxID=139045 RepID=UPI002659CB68|nr:pyrokinin-1 receptor-like [Anopheles coustani]XP_058175717.1 pyrokinin-1 receptor-like [Anopheles ziemanni]
MHTATNYYLFSLAVSDLLLLVTGVPQEIYCFWYRYPYPFSVRVCIMTNFFAETGANATVLTITAFTVERYIAICKPFLSHTLSRLSRAVRFVLAIWLIALSLAIPQALSVHIEQEYKTCTVRHEQGKSLFFISTVVVFMLPMSIITVLYLLIWLQLRRSKLVRSSSQWGSSVRLRHSVRKRRSQRTIVTLHGERTESPGHCSESALTNSMADPKPTEAIQPTPLSPGGTSEASTPERRGLLGGQKRYFRRAQTRRAHGSFSGGAPADVTIPKAHAPIEAQPSGESDDGRINYSNRTAYNSTRHVVKMLVAVVIAFFLCWAPFHAQRLMAVYANEHNQDATVRRAFDLLTYTSGILYFVSTCINPVLYNIMSHKFRAAFQVRDEGKPVHQCEMLANYYNLPPSHPLRTDLFFRNVSLHSGANNSCSTQRLVASVSVVGVRGRPSLSSSECPRAGQFSGRSSRGEETATVVSPDPEPGRLRSSEFEPGVDRPQSGIEPGNEPTEGMPVRPTDLCLTGRNERPERHCRFGPATYICRYDFHSLQVHHTVPGRPPPPPAPESELSRTKPSTLEASEDNDGAP